MSLALIAAMVWQFNQPVVWERTEPTKSEALEMIRNIFPESQEKNAIKIFTCESGLQNIQSQSFYSKDIPKWGVKKGDRELSFNVPQIHLPSHPEFNGERIKIDTKYSIYVAYEIWRVEGWRGAWKNCSERMKVL